MNVFDMSYCSNMGFISASVGIVKRKDTVPGVAV